MIKVSDIGRYMPIPTASGGRANFVFSFSTSSMRDHHGTDGDAETQQAPVQVAAEDALGERGDQRRLRCGERVLTGARCAEETERGVQQVEHGGNHQPAEDDADDQRDLLPPRCGADELAGLEVLKVVVGDGGDAEHDRRGEQRVGHQPRVCLASSLRPCTSTNVSDAATTTRMPRPEIGLLDEPMRPAM